jgi:hypothetical protein
MSEHGNELIDATVDFSKILKERLSKEEIELRVSAGIVDVPGGHLAVILTLDSPDSLPDQRRRAERIAEEECVKYLQGSEKTAK